MRHLIESATTVAERYLEGPTRALEAAVRPAPRPKPRYGQRAFGHSRDRTELVDDEAMAIREAARRVLDGETHTVVVGDWNRRGLRTTAGGPWRVNALSSLLMQERLLGARNPDGSPASPPILDRHTHERLVALRHSRRKGERKPPERYLLTGLLMCWRCGSRLCGMKSCHNRMYVCQPPGHGGCSGTFIQADAVDVVVRQMVAGYIDSTAFTRSLVEAKTDLAGTGTSLVAAWDDMAGDERRRVLDVVVDHIIVLPAMGRRNRFAERLRPVWRA